MPENEPRNRSRSVSGRRRSVLAPENWTTDRSVIRPGMGRRQLPQIELPGHLFYVASLHARRALTAPDSNLNRLDRATSIGTSVELLAKSALTLIAPTLIAEKDPKSALLFSGIVTTPVLKGKTRTASDCMNLLKESHAIDYNPARDAVVFDVRSLALHLGFVDSDVFDEALNKMVALSEELLKATARYDSDLSRESYWDINQLTQVDERLKHEREARIIELEQLKAAAYYSLARLRRLGLNGDALLELADRPPSGYEVGTRHEQEERFARRKCPACAYNGWLEYEPCEITISQDEAANDDAFVRPMDQWIPTRFVCHVCSLRLGQDLLELVNMAKVVGFEPT